MRKSLCSLYVKCAMSEQIYTNKVSIVHFHVFMSFYSIYAILSRIRFCRDLRFFCVNFWGQKLRLCKFFDKYDVCHIVLRDIWTAPKRRLIFFTVLSFLAIAFIDNKWKENFSITFQISSQIPIQNISKMNWIQMDLNRK